MESTDSMERKSLFAQQFHRKKRASKEKEKIRRQKSGKALKRGSRYERHEDTGELREDALPPPSFLRDESVSSLLSLLSGDTIDGIDENALVTGELPVSPAARGPNQSASDKGSISVAGPYVWSGNKKTFNAPVGGRIIIDEGAKEAFPRSRNLLSVGIVNVVGDFMAGDVVEIADENGQLIAKGKTVYPAQHVKQLIGVRSEDIQNVIGYTKGSGMLQRHKISFAHFNEAAAPSRTSTPRSQRSPVGGGGRLVKQEFTFGRGLQQPPVLRQLSLKADTPPANLSYEEQPKPQARSKLPRPKTPPAPAPVALHRQRSHSFSDACYEAHWEQDVADNFPWVRRQLLYGQNNFGLPHYPAWGHNRRPHYHRRVQLPDRPSAAQVLTQLPSTEFHHMQQAWKYRLSHLGSSSSGGASTPGVLPHSGSSKNPPRPPKTKRQSSANDVLMSSAFSALQHATVKSMTLKQGLSPRFGPSFPRKKEGRAAAAPPPQATPSPSNGTSSPTQRDVGKSQSSSSHPPQDASHFHSVSQPTIVSSSKHIAEPLLIRTPSWDNDEGESKHSPPPFSLSDSSFPRPITTIQLPPASQVASITTTPSRSTTGSASATNIGPFHRSVLDANATPPYLPRNHVEFAASHSFAQQTSQPMALACIGFDWSDGESEGERWYPLCHVRLPKHSTIVDIRPKVESAINKRVADLARESVHLFLVLEWGIDLHGLVLDAELEEETTVSELLEASGGKIVVRGIMHRNVSDSHPETPLSDAGGSGFEESKSIRDAATTPVSPSFESAKVQLQRRLLDVNPSQAMDILMLAASPLVDSKAQGNYAPVLQHRYDKEREAIYWAVTSTGLAVNWEFKFANREVLLEQLVCGTRILHFSGHGSAVSSKKGSVSYLKLEQPDGTSDFLFNSRFVEILNGLKCKPDLIFFSSCQSYQLAEDVTKHGGIKVAIGVSQAIFDTHAIMFARQFYLALLSHYDVRQAFENAKKHISRDAVYKGKGANDVIMVESKPGIARSIVLFPPGIPKRIPRLLHPLECCDLPLLPGDFTGRQKDVYDIINLIRRFPLTVVHGRPRVGTSTATLAAARFLSERCSLLKPTALQKHFPQGCLWLTVCSKNIEDCIGYFLSAVATRCHTRLDHQLSSTGQGMAVLKRVQEWYRRSGMVDVELPPSYCLTVGERVATHIARLKQLDDHCDAEMLKRRTRSLTVAITLMLEVLALVKLFLVFDNAQLFINPSRPTSDKATASPHCAMFALLLVTIMEVAQPVHIVITARQSLNLDELFSHALQHAGAISPAMTEAATFFFQQSTVLSHPEGTKVISAFSAEEAMRLFGRGFDMQALQQLSKHQSWDSAVRAFCKANADNPDKIRKIRETVRLFKDTEGWVEKYIDLLLHRGGNERDH